MIISKRVPVLKKNIAYLRVAPPSPDAFPGLLLLSESSDSCPQIIRFLLDFSVTQVTEYTVKLIQIFKLIKDVLCNQVILCTTFPKLILIKMCKKCELPHEFL